jgi:TetR/AcrR family transcriptional repressor of nem operon
MAGVKQFDPGEALDRAMAAFWRRGYAATSIQDVIECTGVNRGSLYATFGGKRELFLAVLDRYAEKIGSSLALALADPDPRRAIERMFEAIIERNRDPKWPRGCLNTNTSIECPGAGEQIVRKIAERLGNQESAIYAVLRRAQAEGSLRRDADARAMARFFMCVAQSLNVIHRVAPDPAIPQDAVRIAMTVWDKSERGGRTGRSRPRRHESRDSAAGEDGGRRLTRGDFNH